MLKIKKNKGSTIERAMQLSGEFDLPLTPREKEAKRIREMLANPKKVPNGRI